MSDLTLEVEIDHGRIVPREPERLPEKGNGLLTILHSAMPPSGGKPARQRVELPLIRGDGKRLICFHITSIAHGPPVAVLFARFGAGHRKSRQRLECVRFTAAIPEPSGHPFST